MKIESVCVIPARGGSKGIPEKNKRLLNGKPLVFWTIKQAIDSQCFDKILVSTDDPDIANIAINCNVEVYNRSKATAEDDVHAIWAILECIKNIDVNIVCMLLPTSPLRLPADICNGMNIFINEFCDSVVSVMPYDKPISCIRKYVNETLSPIINIKSFEQQRQDIEQLYEVNGSIYISNKKNLLENKSFHKGNVKPYIMNKLRSIDINTIDDFKLAELLMKDATK